LHRFQVATLLLSSKKLERTFYLAARPGVEPVYRP
jgi:hypothetical protein